MYPIINLFGIHIGTYGLCILLGGLAAFAVIFYCIKSRFGKEKNDFFLAYIFSVAFSVLGAVLLKPVINTIIVAVHYENYKSMALGSILTFLFGEVVFYGGLIGAILGLAFYCRMYKTPLLPLLDIGAVGVPLAHSIGRVGCMFGGCCWGTVTAQDNPFSIIYPTYPMEAPSGITAPSGIPLWNVPIMEAAFLAILFIINFIIYHRSRRNGICFAVYLLLYGTWRFAIEYIRGDAIRGKYYIFTTSQYISILLIITGILILVNIAKRTSPTK
jgi:phosphatidylglycerol:prolipoprotein diacylglycerol transferase